MQNKKTRSEDCFTVHVSNGGDLMKFDTCLADNNLIPSLISSPICTYKSFMKHMQKLAFNGDINKQCLQTWNPPSEKVFLQ